MQTNYNQISFSSLTAAFLAIGIFKSLNAYLNSLKIKNKKQVKNTKQIELWINSYTSFNSVVSFVGFTTETYYYGARLLINLVAISIGYIFSFFILQPFFYDVDVKSPYEYMHKRYGNRLICRIISSFVGIVFHISFTTLFLWANATILSTIFPDLSLSISIIIIGSVSLLFAISGGLLQSMYTNSFQMIIFVFGITSALCLALIMPEGELDYYWNQAKNDNRLNFIVSSNDLSTRYTVWNQLFSLPIPWCGFHGLLVPNINRYKQIKPRKNSSIFIISNLPVMFIINTIAVFCGILSYITFFNCDPYLSNQIQNKNQIASFFLITAINKKLPSVAGLCLSALFVQGLVQHSFGISLSAQIFINEIINPISMHKTEKNLQQVTLNIIKPILVIIIGILSIFYSLSFQYVKNSILSLFFIFNNSINSPLFALFLLSMFNPYANHVGAFSSFIIALGINFWLGISAVTTAMSNPKSQEFIQNITQCSNLSEFRFVNANATYKPENQTLFYLYSISSIWYCLFSLLFILIFGSIFSLLYSLITKRRWDLDENFKKERLKYLFSFKKNFVFKNCIKINKYEIDSEINEFTGTRL
jgi:Na+/proline symporter